MIFDLLKKEVSTIIDSPDKLDELLRCGGESSSGVHVTPTAAARFAPVYSCVKVLAESVGQLPLHLFEEKAGIKNKAINHRLFPLLYRSPNTFQTSQEWREMVVSHLCFRGNHYSFVNRITAGVKELLPLNPDSVRPVQNDDYEVKYHVTFSNGTQDVLDSSQVLHIKLMSTDGVVGMSPIRQARESIGLGIATEKYGSVLFRNGARPAGILTSDGGLKKEQIELIREQWEATHGGTENAHKVAILQGGLKWMSVGLAAEDAQFLETRKYQRSEIAGLFRVPPHMVGDLEKATFSNIEHQGLEFVIHTLMPYLTRIEQRIETQLLTPAEQRRYFAKFNVRGLLRGDMKNRSDFYNKMVSMGALSPNEIRELEDMNPRDGGDIYLTPLNMAVNGENPEADDANKET